VVDDGETTLVDAGWPGDVEDSVRSLCRRSPEFEYACPGHGPSLANGSVWLAAAVP